MTFRPFHIVKPRGAAERSPVLTVLLCLFAAGCADTSPKPAAPPPAPVTRATAVDPATTQPFYWLDQPPVAWAHARDYDRLWSAAQKTARSYLFQLDEEDYRQGLLTTLPMVSKLPIEFWRKDTGDAAGELRNSLTTMRRTLRFEITRDPDGAFTLIPKVLVEQKTVLERRITSEAQYQTIFSGPMGRAQDSADVAQDVPVIYWTPVGRDTEMEKQVAAEVTHRL